MVHIEHAISYPTNQALFGDPKAFAGDRYIDLIEPFKSQIRQHIDSIDGIYLFADNLGKLMPKTTFRRFWDSIIRKLNTTAGGKQHWDNEKKKWIIDINAIEGLSPHIFRHNYATNLYYADVDLKEAQRLLGHADAKTVIEMYTHLDKEKSKSKSKIQNFYNAI